jgi:outer membrane protein OmpA-like peptidoglycan-associated protein
MSKLHFFLFILFLQLFQCKYSFTQTQFFIRPENADCSSAIELKDTIFGPTNPPDGYGFFSEFNALEEDLYSFEKEHNSVWYKFTIKQNSILTFDIIPISPKDDYDFLLFKNTGEDFCEDLKAGKILPVRTNISRNEKQIKSKTGLSHDATEEFVHSGHGEPYSKEITVNKGEVYYLVLDNVYANGNGHTLYLHFKPIPAPINKKPINKKVIIKKDSIKVIPKKDQGKTLIHIVLFDSLTHESLHGDIALVNISKQKYKSPEIIRKDTNELTGQIIAGQKFLLTIAAKGYLPFCIQINTKKTDTLILYNINLQKVKVGLQYDAENILFYGNETKLLPISYVDLNNIVNFLKENPSIHMQIQGHVNSPKKYTFNILKKIYIHRLSKKRAKLVYEYLVKNGIDKKRLSFKGMGAKKMKYPYTKKLLEMQKNRRVEIHIISE